MMNEALKKAIDHFGSQQKLGELLSKKQVTISYWLHTGKIPPECAKEIEELTAGAVKRADLRPDIFG